MYKLLLALAICQLCTGCVVPTVFPDKPGVSGRVLDSNTNSPIKSATITLQSEDSVIKTISSKAGKFSIPSKSHIEVLFYFAPFDRAFRKTKYLIIIQKEGYRSAYATFDFPQRENAPLGDVILKSQ